jgi:hypothetical protein
MSLRRVTITTAALAVLLATAGAGAGQASGASGSPVDPDTLTPPPPPGATCQQAGRQVICQTSVEFHYQNQPAFELPCGLLYESIDDVRRGARWYVDGLMTKRLVFQDMAGSWSLSPDGAGPQLFIMAHANWRNVGIDFTAPEVEWFTTFHGVGLQVKDEGGHILFQFSGYESPEGHNGRGDFADLEGPEGQAAMCDALT